jgi:hypothetical protein
MATVRLDLQQNMRGPTVTALYTKYTSDSDISKTELQSMRNIICTEINECNTQHAKVATYNRTTAKSAWQT